MFDAIVNDIKYVEVAHARYESFMSNRTCRSSGGIADNDGVFVLSTELGRRSIYPVLNIYNYLIRTTAEELLRAMSQTRFQKNLC